MRTVGLRTLLYGWNIMRVLRLGMGIFAIWQAFVTREWILGLAGAFLLYMALANVGCCGTGGCAVPPGRFRKRDSVGKGIGDQ